MLQLTAARNGEWIKVQIKGSWTEGSTTISVDTKVHYKAVECFEDTGIKTAARSMAGEVYAKSINLTRLGFIHTIEAAMQACIPLALSRGEGKQVSGTVRRLAAGDIEVLLDEVSRDEGDAGRS